MVMSRKESRKSRRDGWNLLGIGVVVRSVQLLATKYDDSQCERTTSIATNFYSGVLANISRICH